jgi:hypothetical protein
MQPESSNVPQPRFWHNVKAWAVPRRRSIIGGLAPIVVALIVFAALGDQWWFLVGGLIGLLIGATGVVMFVGRPDLWEDPQRRWLALGWWAVGWTLVSVALVCLIFWFT